MGRLQTAVQGALTLPPGFKGKRALKFLAGEGQLSSGVWKVLWGIQDTRRMPDVRSGGGWNRAGMGGADCLLA